MRRRRMVRPPLRRGVAAWSAGAAEAMSWETSSRPTVVRPARSDRALGVHRRRAAGRTAGAAGAQLPGDDRRRRSHQHLDAAAGGPIAALTAMSHERGITVETLKFRQIRSGEGTATFICGSNGTRPSGQWAGRTTRRSRRCVRGDRLRQPAIQRRKRCVIPAASERAQHDRRTILRYRHATVVPASLVARPGQFQPQGRGVQPVQDRLDLQLAQHHPPCAWCAAAERREHMIAVSFVLVPRLGEALGSNFSGSVQYSGGRSIHPGIRDDVASSGM